MGRQQIEFLIRPDGTVEERVLGVAGPDCEKMTEDIERALGEVIKRERTGDYYNPQTQGTTETASTHTH